MQPELSHGQLDHLRAIAQAAAAECSKMFSKWVKSDVSISMENLKLVPFQDVLGSAARSSEISVCLYMNFDGGLKGSLLFSLPEKSARELLALLLRKKDVAEIGELEESALKETANILGCAYLNSMSKSMELEVIPGPPILIQDLTVAILESVLAQQAAVQNQALLIEVEFGQSERHIDCAFYFLPLLETLEKKL